MFWICIHLNFDAEPAVGSMQMRIHVDLESNFFQTIKLIKIINFFFIFFSFHSRPVWQVFHIINIILSIVISKDENKSTLIVRNNSEFILFFVAGVGWRDRGQMNTDPNPKHC